MKFPQEHELLGHITQVTSCEGGSAGAVGGKQDYEVFGPGQPPLNEWCALQIQMEEALIPVFHMMQRGRELLHLDPFSRS